MRRAFSVVIVERSLRTVKNKCVARKVAVHFWLGLVEFLVRSGLLLALFWFRSGLLNQTNRFTFGLVWFTKPDQALFLVYFWFALIHLRIGLVYFWIGLVYFWLGGWVYFRTFGAGWFIFSMIAQAACK